MYGSANADSKVWVFPGAPREDYSALPENIRLPVEEIERNGFTLLRNQLSAEQCRQLREATARVYEAEVAEFGGVENMSDIGDAGVSRSPFLRDEAFLIPLQLPDVVAVARQMLSKAMQVNLQRVVISSPSKVHAASIWHRDFSYQDFTSSKPLALTALAMLDGSNPENGGPSVLPASHRYDRFPTDEFALRHAVPLDCEPGDVFLLDSALYHRGGRNIGTVPRHSVVTIYTVPVIRQNVDYPRLLNGKYSNDPELRMLMGYNTKMPASDLEYRLAKLESGKKISENRAV